MVDNANRNRLQGLIRKQEANVVPVANPGATTVTAEQPAPEPEGSDATMLVSRPYVPERVSCNMRLQPAYRDALRQLAAQQGEKQPDLLESALELLFEKHGVKFKRPKPPRSAQVRKS